jgi:glutamate-1-semialdehyde aminotransferase/acyl carrier protein
MSARIPIIAARLKGIIHELSGYPIEDLAEHGTFLELGFDSLFLTQLSTAFQKEFGVRITFRQLFDEMPSIATLAAHLDARLPVDANPAPLAQAAAAPAATLDAGPPADRPPSRAAATQPSPDMPAAVALLPPLPVGAAPANGGAASRSTVIQAVMAQQLEVMQRQLELLGGGAVPVSQLQMSEPAVVAAGSLPASTPVPALATVPPASSAEHAAPAELPAGFGPSGFRPARTDLTPRQRRHLDDLIARYTARTAGSRHMTQQYRRWHADPRTAAGFNPLWKEMVYPLVVQRSSGSRLWDVDGNEYIDLLNGFGPNFLGHSPPFITEALKAQLDRGIEVGPQALLAGETAELFCRMTGNDRVSFVNTGSEAVQAAIRLSRTFTGRDRIVLFHKDYHGNFDEVLVRGITVGGRPRSMPLAPGIPRRALDDVVVLEYGSDEALDWIRTHAHEVAAILVEPVQSRRPELQPREFLHEIRRITQESGTVLVFDEVITGFRMGPRGAQAFYGVEADLATYGKVFGGGMAIGAVAGKAQFMDTFDGGMWEYGDESFPAAGVTFFAGTFVRHPMAIAAANTVLKYLDSVGPSLQESVARTTSRLAAGLNQLFESNGIDIQVPHCCSQMFIRVNEPGELATLLFYHLRDRGVHVLDGFPTYMTAAHTDEDVDALLERFASSVAEMQDGEMLPRPAGAPAAMSPEEFPLTSSQRDVWVAAQFGDDASCAFNESDTVELRGRLDVEALTRAVDSALRRHQAFGLVLDRDGTVQSCRPPAAFELVVHDVSSVPEVEARGRVDELLRTQALTPFDLTSGPLVRPLLVRLGEEHHLLVLYAHHIIFDGWSADVVLRDIAEAYSAAVESRPPALPAPVPYSDYVAAQAEFDASDDGTAALGYWRSIFRDVPSGLELPTDRQRPVRRTYAGGTVHAALAPALSGAVKGAARSLGLTAHALLLSAFQVLLSRLSAQEEFVVGVPAAGQAAAGTEHLVGYCVNLLPVRAACTAGIPFSEFAHSTRNAVLDAFEYQRADLGRLSAELPLDRDPSRLPLVEVVFNFSAYLRDLQFSGLQALAHENPRRAILHDMFLNVVDGGGRLVVDWDYNADLFDADTIKAWLRHYEVLLAGIVAAPHTPVDRLPLLPDDIPRGTGGARIDGLLAEVKA